MSVSPSNIKKKRADEIVQWALETKRNPTDTAGMDTDDEEWLGENLEWEGYIEDEWEREKEEDKRRNEERRMNKLQKAQQRLALSKVDKYREKLIPEYDTLIELAKTFSRKKLNKEVQKRMEEEYKLDKKTMKKSLSRSPPKYDGKKYNYQGTKFGWKTKNTLKKEYKNAKTNSKKYKELKEWKDNQKDKYKNVKSDELEPEPPSVFDDDGKGIGKFYEGQELALEGHEPEPEPANEVEEHSQVQGPSKNDSVSFETLPDDLYENLLNEIVFDNQGIGKMNPKRCRRLIEFCTLFPKTCAFDEKFREKYVYPCTKYGRHITDKKTYDQLEEYKSSITPIDRETVREYRNRDAYMRYGPKWDMPASRYVKTYMRPTELNPGNFGSMKKYGSQALGDTIQQSPLSWRDLQMEIILDPELLDEIISDFRIEARKYNYNERTIDYMVRKIVDSVYDHDGYDFRNISTYREPL